MPEWLTADWAMVGITTIYVIATIFICVANIKSSHAASNQLKEMKRQYEEDNRANLETEFIYENKAFYGLRFVNHGRHTAEHVKISFKEGFIDSLPEEMFRNILKEQQGKECIIGAGQHYDLFIGSDTLREQPNMKPASGTVSYTSNHQPYFSDFSVDLQNYIVIFSVSTDHDDLLETIKKQTRELSEITSAIRKLK